MFAAILDTCVLWPSAQRDFLLSMAVEGLYRPLWSEAILDELHLHEQRKLEERGSDQASARQKADRLLAKMREHFADALVEGWQPLDGTYGLPDPDDEHVVAAAVIGGAGAIVTENLRHFPATRVPPSVQVLTAKEFAADSADLSPHRAARAIKEMSKRRARETPHQIVEILRSRYQMVEVADLVLPILDEWAARKE